MAPYDSTADTRHHISTVQSFMDLVADELDRRANSHDQSKFEPPEKAVFDEYTPKLKDSTYGSDEYKSFLAEMGEGLKHHYEVNDHHPEHFKDGIHEMTLVQMVEMLCDWKAATLRHANGDLGSSIRNNADRFGYGAEIENLLHQTAEAFGWL